MDELEVRRAVRDAYGSRAESCGPSEAACCSPSAPGEIPKLGVGDPATAADLRPGETVLDLGSGPGRDVLRAAQLVGPTGRAIGIDATPEMVFRAREAARERGVRNAEFRLAEMEHLPVETGSVDVVISDCAVNLVPDKPPVFREIFRVLRPGGRVLLSDVVTEGELPEAVRADPRAWAACVAGAVREEDYRRQLAEAGFEEVQTLRRAGPALAGLGMALIGARKPSGVAGEKRQ